MIKLNYKYSFIILNVALTLLYLLLFSPYTTPLNPYYGYDDNIFMIIGQGINKGFIPYKDLFDHKGPILFFIYALADIIAHGKTGVFVLQIINLYFINLYIYKIAKLYKSNSKSVYLIIFSFFAYFTGTIGEGAMNEEFSLLPLLICFYLALKQISISKENKITLPIYVPFIYGISFAFTFLIRANNSALICGLIIGFTILLFRCKQYKLWFNSILAFLIGFSLVCLPITYYFIKNDAFYDFIYYSFSYNYIYAVEGIKNRSEILIKILWLLPTIILSIISYKYFSFRERIIIVPVLILSLFSVSLGNSYLHYYTLLIPLIILFFSKIINNMEKKKVILIFSLCFIPYAYTSAKNFAKIFYFDILKSRYEYYKELEKIYNLIPINEKDNTVPIELNYRDYALYSKFRMTPSSKFFFFQNKFSKDLKEVENNILNNLKSSKVNYVLVNDIRKINSNEIQNYILNHYDLVYNKKNSDLAIQMYKKKYNK